jgi:hypothetical protein
MATAIVWGSLVLVAALTYRVIGRMRRRRILMRRAVRQ